MLAPTFGAELPPLWPGWIVLVVNLAVTGSMLVVSRSGAVTAVALGAAVALPFWAALVHSWSGDVGQSASLTAAVAGSGAAAAVLAGPRFGSLLVLGTTTWIATAVVWLSLLAAAAELLGLPVTASYDVNERTWLAPWQLRGIAGHPNQLALLGVLALVLQVDLIRRQRRDWGRPLLLAAVVLGPIASLFVVLWTQSRTGWISLVAAVLVLLLPWRRDRHAILAAVVITVLLAALVAPPTLTDNPLAFNGRGVAWSVARWAIEQEPWLGWGTFAFSDDFWQQYGELFPFAYWSPVHAHNLLLQAGALLGAVGITVTVAAVAACLVAATKARRFDRGLTLALLAALAVSAGVEAAFGTGQSGAVYLPVLLLAGAVGAAIDAERGRAD